MKTLIKSVLPVIMALAALGCYAQSSKHVDANGYYNVLNAPQTNSKFRAQSTQNNDGSYTTNIYKGKKLLQVLKHEATSGDVRFIDMNFDGHVDIFLGPATVRANNFIYLYDKKKAKFTPAKLYPAQKEGSTFSGCVLINEKKKHFVTMHTGDVSDSYFQLYTWKGNKPVAAEGLFLFNDPTKYELYGVETKYTFYGGPLDYYYSPEGVGCKCIRTNDIKDLPKEWQKILESFEIN